jgi:RNA polymerase sigma factor (TIGR02999 family)
MAASPHEVTQLLFEWRNGDATAFDKLLPLVYDELRRIASRYMKRERAGHTLQTTALVNEAYLRLVNQQGIDWQDRAHFFAVAAQVMRHLLVDHARANHYAKRGGNAVQVTLDEGAIVTESQNVEILALDEALTRLAAMDERKVKIVELRYFGGLSAEETAAVLDLSEITVKREWLKAKAWLFRELTQEANHEAGALAKN